MKRSLSWMALAGLCAVGCGCTGVTEQTAGERAAVKAERGLMQAVIVEKGPPVDGTLQSPIWRECPPLVLGECTTDKPGPMKTTARVLFDPTHLYVAWECEEPDTDGMRQQAAKRDGQVWADDSVELFVTGDTRRGYFHFAVNPRGTLFDSRSTPGKRDDTSYNTGATVSASVEENRRWIVTLSVPLKDIGAYVGEDQTWVMNLNRTKPGAGSQAIAEWSWAVMGSNDYHQVLDYGQVKGVKVRRRDDGVTRTASRPPPPPQYDKGAKAGSVIVYRHFPEMTIRDRGGGTAKSIDLRIRGSAGLKVAFLARGTGGVGSVPLNMYDKRANDNTTSKAYRTVGERFRPMLHRCDRFRYNAVIESTVSRNTEYSNLRFHGNQTGGKGVLHLRELTIYRGEDTDPPAAPAGLKGEAGPDGVKLTWKPAEDNVGIAAYVISRASGEGGFVKIAESRLPEYVDRHGAGRRRYRILAVDFQDNLSGWSKPVTVSNPLDHPQPEPTQLEQDRAAYAERVRQVAAAGAGKVRRGVVMCFGDSLTGATNYRTYTESALGRYDVVAFGRAGWRTSGGRRVIQGDLEKTNPQFCLILYGTNNSKGEKAIEAGMDDMLFIARACEKRGTIPIIGTIPPRGFSDAQSKPEARYNKALIKLCRDNNIPIAYIFRDLQAQPDRRKLLAGDGVHFVSGGWAVVGPAWARAVNGVNFVLLDRP